VPHDPRDVAQSQSLREEWAPPARHSLAVSAVATALWRTSGRKFRSPTAHAGAAAHWKSVAVAIFSTVHHDMRGRSLDRHPISVHGKNSGFGCQSAFVAYAQNSLCVLLRLLFSAEPLRLSRRGGSGQKFNSVVSHAFILSRSEVECPLFRAAHGSLRSVAGDGALRMCSCAATIAATSPGIVYSRASMSTGSPNSRSVADVTGPMDAVCTP